MKNLILIISSIFFSVHSFAQNRDSTLVEHYMQEPEFEGGFSEYLNFMKQNLVYPEYARLNFIEGKVLIQLLIEKDGTVSKAKVIESPDTSLSKEAARVLFLTKWTPAKLENGEPTSYEYTVPVVFRLEKPEENNKKKRKNKR
jgi:TonB family protein